MLSSHHEVAAVDVEDGAGDVVGALRCGKAEQIGYFERSAEPPTRAKPYPSKPYPSSMT